MTNTCKVAAFPAYSVSLDHCTNNWSCVSCYMCEKQTKIFNNIILNRGQFFFIHASLPATRAQSSFPFPRFPRLGCSKVVYTNPGLKVSPSIHFCCIKMSFTAYVLFSDRLFKTLNRGTNNINRKPHRKVTKTKSKFSLILGKLKATHTKAEKCRTFLPLSNTSRRIKQKKSHRRGKMNK